MAYFKVLYLYLPTGTGDSRSRGSSPGTTECEQYTLRRTATIYYQ
jgi:hypothetical protein